MSTQEQASTGVSLSAQESAIRAYATMRGLTITTMAVDAGVSAGKPLGSREGGQRVLDLVRSRSVTAVVAFKLDRVFRDCADCLGTVREWDQLGVALHLVDLGGQTIDTSSAMGRFFLTVMAGAAELERNLVSERTKTALAQVKKEGGHVGRDALGWQRTNATDDAGRRIVIQVAEEAATVARIVALREAGRSLSTIAQCLTEEGRPTKRGGRWTPETIRRALAREHDARELGT